MDISPMHVERGLLVRDGGGFALRRDRGGTVRLDLLRTPVDHVEKRVEVRGIYTADDMMEVQAIMPLDRGPPPGFAPPPAPSAD